MSICKENFGGDWLTFFYRIPWTVAIRGVVDAPWYEDEKTAGADTDMDCENLSDEDIFNIQQLAKK